MVSVTITEKGGKATERDFNQPEITIGRVQGNDIALPKSNVSKRHARIVRNGHAYTVIDAKSTNGTYVNGKRIAAPTELRVGDKVFIGDFTLEIRPHDEDSSATRKPERQQVKTRELPAEGMGAEAQPPWASSGDLQQDWHGDWEEAAAEEAEPLGAEPSVVAAPQEAARPRRDSTEAKGPARGRRPSGGGGGGGSRGADAAAALRLLHERLLAHFDGQRPALEGLDDAEVRQQVADAVRELGRAMDQADEIPAGLDAATLVDRALAEALGLGPLQECLADPSVTEILVNHPHQVFVERRGRLEPVDIHFSSDAAILGIIQRIVAPLGRRFHQGSPMVDARLRDGSRVNAVLPPLSIKGPTLTIRKFTREPLQIDDLVAGGGMNADMAEFLEVCVQARKNIVIAGGTGAGKTTLLNVMSSFIDATERIITIEDAAELKLDQEHVVALESRPAGTGRDGEHDEVTIRDLVRNALRMRPDRIVVGECRGSEALDMLQAMNTGHDGSLTTVHANTPRDAVTRLETMVLMAGMDLPARAVREQLVSAVDIVVQQSRFADGTRRITHISEVVGMEGEVVSMHDLFVFDQLGFGSDGRVQGRFRASGFVPKFYEGLRMLGLEPNLAIFRNT